MLSRTHWKHFGIKQGRRSGGWGLWPENSWARHLSVCVSLRRIVLAHTEVTATASDTFWHLLLVAGFHDKHPHGSTTAGSHLTRTHLHHRRYSKPPIPILTAADNSCTHKKKGQKVNILSQGCSKHMQMHCCCVLHLNIDSWTTLEPSGLCVLQTLTQTGTLIWHVLDQREICFQD